MARRMRPGGVAVVCTAALLGGVLSVTTWEAGRAGTVADSALARPSSFPGVEAATTPSAPATDTARSTSVTAGSAALPPVTDEVERAPSLLDLPGGEQMPVDAVGVHADGTLAGQMVVPEDPRVAGWYRHGTSPVEDAGAVVVAAHVDRAGIGAGPLARLDRMRPGEEVALHLPGGRVTYRITQVEVLDKEELDPAALFDRQGSPRLHLVSCGGDYDRARRHYAANVVVTAERVG